LVDLGSERLLDLISTAKLGDDRNIDDIGRERSV
jgi:hypothetical protein